MKASDDQSNAGIGAGGFLSTAKKRYSVREYSGMRVENEKIETIIDAGRVAPTAANIQPIKLLVIQSAEGIAKLSKGEKNAK